MALAKLPCEKSTVSVSSPARVSTMIWLPATEEKGTVTELVPEPAAPAMPVDKTLLGSEMTNWPLAVSDSNVSVSSVSPPSVSVMTRFSDPSSEIVVALRRIRGSSASSFRLRREGRRPRVNGSATSSLLLRGMALLLMSLLLLCRPKKFACARTLLNFLYLYLTLSDKSLSPSARGNPFPV